MQLHTSFLQATHRPVRDFSLFFEHLIASSAVSPPHYFPARFSSIISSTSAWFFNLFIHRSVASSKRLQADTHPRFEPTAPPSFFACSRPPFSLIQSRPIIRSLHVSSACVLRELFPRVLITLFIDIWTFRISDMDTGTLIYSLLSREFLYCTRLYLLFRSASYLLCLMYYQAC